MLSYQSVLSVACVVLALRYVFDSEASVLGRVVIAAITISAFLMPSSPAGQAVSIVSQLGVALFSLLRLRVLTIQR